MEESLPTIPESDAEYRAASFTVRSENYEGPLEVLLDLIERRKLLVNEISLAQVTDDFIAHVRTATTFPISDAADFISIAATLLLIKSRSLLPDLELTPEEEGDVHDLELRLALYEKVRDASRGLALLYGSKFLYPAGERAQEVSFAPGPKLDSTLLFQTLHALLETREQVEQLPEARIRPLVSIEEMMDTLSARVSRALTLSFKEFTGDKVEKVEVIVSFLALLELVKQGSVEVLQHGSFNDISISSLENTLPRY
jgi:segregation and condensation protein A